MHRISAGLLIALFGFALVSPAVFASGGDSNLPPCCRRTGKHHCSMQEVSSSGGPALRNAPCPLFPSPPNMLVNRAPTVLGSRPPSLSAWIGRPANPPEIKSISRIFYLRPGEKRGPPALLS